MRILKAYLNGCISVLSFYTVSTSYTSYGNSSLLQRVDKIGEAIPEIDPEKTDDVKWAPFDDAPPPLSDENPSDKVRFYIFTGPGGAMKRIRMGNGTNHDEGVPSKILTPGKPIVILVHGYLGSCSEDNFPGLLVQAYFKVGRSDNILCVDWSELSYHGNGLNMMEYWVSTTNGLIVGKKLADFIASLVRGGGDKRDEDLGRVHVIGYSVGAHVGGTAGALVHKLLGVKIGRVTGLDPAFPFYSTRPLEERLDPSDADFVDVYHTNGGLLGYADRIGHSDFYINGGVSQPECRNTGNPKLDSAELLTGSCSHQMVPHYYAESIQKKVKVRACNASAWKTNPKDSSCTEMVHFGEESTLGPVGAFYVFIGAKRFENIWIPELDFSKLALLRFMF